MKKTVLLIDPSNDWARIIRNGFNERVTLVWVPSFDLAQQTVRNRHNLDAIVIGWSTGNETLEFIRALRPWYNGVLVAATPEPTMNTFLVAYGCTHSVLEKSQASEEVWRLIGRS